MDSFLTELSPAEQEIIEGFRECILTTDSTVVENTGSFMNNQGALVYKQEDVFKYALARTKNHFTLHSMVMYAYPETVTQLKEQSSKLKFQKGCINFKSLSDFPLSEFSALIQLFAEKDFTPILQHYKSKKK